MNILETLKAYQENSFVCLGLCIDASILGCVCYRVTHPTIFFDRVVTANIAANYSKSPAKEPRILSATGATL